MSRWLPRARPVALCLGLVLVSSCAAPPNREIEAAEAALKAAKAAGAERYAPSAESYKQAAAAYTSANLAVTDGDYRLALSRALESRELSQAAVRIAGDAHAQARDEVLQMMTQVATLLARAGAELDAAERRRVPRTVLRDVRQTLALVDADVQKASAAIKRQDFEEAKVALTGVKTRLDKALASLDTARPVQPSKRTQS